MSVRSPLSCAPSPAPYSVLHPQHQLQPEEAQAPPKQPSNLRTSDLRAISPFCCSYIHARRGARVAPHLRWPPLPPARRAWVCSAGAAQPPPLCMAPVIDQRCLE